MQSTIEVNPRNTYGNIDITLPDGKMFRITVFDASGHIEVVSFDGSMTIKPKVSNHIEIHQ